MPVQAHSGEQAINNTAVAVVLEHYCHYNI